MKSALLYLAAVTMAFGAGIAFAQQREVSTERGKALFNDPGLGTNGRTCATCHGDGKGLEQAGLKPGLDQIINGCIINLLKGNALDPRSVDMQSLVLYVKSIGKKRPAAKNRPATGC